MTYSFREARFQIYVDSQGMYRWRMVGNNGKTQCQGEDYPTKANAERGVFAVIKNITGVPPCWAGKAEWYRGSMVRKINLSGRGNQPRRTMFIEYAGQ